VFVAVIAVHFSNQIPASAGAPQAAPATPVRRAKRKLDDDTPLSSSLSVISPQVAADRIADAKKDVRTPNGR
jgi:hypothetical protein